MSSLKFEWDPYKAVENQEKHGISFDEATSAFYDELGVEFYDDEHDDWEDRFLLIGMSIEVNLLLICHCYRDDDSVIRIISARKATKSESEFYPG